MTTIENNRFLREAIENNRLPSRKQQLLPAFKRITLWVYYKRYAELRRKMVKMTYRPAEGETIDTVIELVKKSFEKKKTETYAYVEKIQDVILK